MPSQNGGKLKKTFLFRMELRQKSKQEEVERRKVEDRRRRERENAAGMREAWGSGGGREALDNQVGGEGVELYSQGVIHVETSEG